MGHRAHLRMSAIPRRALLFLLPFLAVWVGAVGPASTGLPHLVGHAHAATTTAAHVSDVGLQHVGTLHGVLNNSAAGGAGRQRELIPLNQGSVVGIATRVAAKGESTFYTVQSSDDAARLASGGAPWKTAPSEAEFGPGVYAWGNADDAANYAAHLRESRGACVQVCEFSLDTSNLRHVDVDSLADPGAFMSKFSQLWEGTPNHGLDYITRGTGRGVQHYFSPSAFRSATWIGPR